MASRHCLDFRRIQVIKRKIEARLLLLCYCPRKDKEAKIAVRRLMANNPHKVS